jgi:hypothetical protein
VKIYVATMEALRIRKRQDEAQFCEFQPPFTVFFLLFLQVFLNLTPCMTKLKVQVLCFPDFTYNHDFLIFKEKNKISIFFL